MVKYPQTIADAVKILDNYDNKWAEKVSVNLLDFEDFDDCLLGQVFSGSELSNEYGYKCGMTELFGINVDFDHDAVYEDDEIFGKSAPKDRWIKEIRKRVKEKIYEVVIKGRKTKLTQSQVNELYDILDPLTGR